MIKRKVILSLAATLVAVPLLVGCSPPFPKELLEKVENVPFTALQKDPDKYAGKLLMIGGIIVATTNLKEETRIEVLQKSLDHEGRPELTDETGGRFLIMTKQFLDGAVYHRGRLITVIGEIAGLQVLPIGETEYCYPVITATALHLWLPYSGPYFSVGVGVYR